ncbi:NUDIX hydrolase [Rubrobacter indicoceani]|uniref:NUDIX hydrolase n=1 Tax=Rubrobacter indicoceani TaxID=2051957 RepID=UPI000E5AE92B|nr:NUDIX domain-containing protein [Rubrobacter indicoceani]
MIVHDTLEARFNFRVAKACLHGDHALARTTQYTDFYVLPGGRVEMGEDSVFALRRGMREEIGCNVEVGRLPWVVENFFSLEGRNYHEISLIYKMMPEDPALLNPNRTLRRTPADEPDELTFRWLALNTLASNTPQTT